MTKLVRKVVVENHGRNGKVVKKIVIGIAKKTLDIGRLVASWNKRRRIE